jgi:hypothetical protein
MKVLEKGTGQRGWSKECTCTGSGNGNGGCGAKLLVEEADLFQTKNCDWTGDCDYFSTFACVECGVLTDMKDVPYQIVHKLKPRGHVTDNGPK